MKPVTTALCAVLCSAFLAGCSSSPSTTSPPLLIPKEVTAASAGKRPLTREEASERAKQITHVTYGLWFGLDGTNNDYEGRTSIRFELRPKAKDHGKELFLDFHGGTLRSLVVNGTTVTNLRERFDGDRIHFSIGELAPGSNRIEISFLHDYSSNGSGLYRFKDPEDGGIYLYTDFEPFSAHEAFPCFDQPDLKASFELTAAVPDGWQVVSNTLERDVSLVDGRRAWIFPPTPLLSTYVFALIAGDYASWKSDARGIPIRLFARKSLKKYLNEDEVDEWLDITRDGLEFYATQFGYPYPYSKFDQILVPDFNNGGMENAAAVTYTERLAFRTRVSQRQRAGRASVILHEMAHMWFGDLVTMKWWNGLWLNETFATFMATWAVDEATDFPGAWEDFSAGKNGAYWQDQLQTTHPVDQPVIDTDHAMASFDSITYGKGAALIKQLRYYLGEEDFREGIQRYFEKYALRNTTMGDFMKMLSEASEKDLKEWQEAWLMTPGVNTVQAAWACGTDGRITKLALHQGNAPESAVLRPHRAEVALFYAKNGKSVVNSVIPVTYSAADTPVDEALGKRCPQFVYPNHDDQDYVKVLLDPVSLRFLLSGRTLSHVVDFEGGAEEGFMTREMVWSDLWRQVEDGTLSAQAYFETALKNLEAERTPRVIQEVLGHISQRDLSRDTALKYLPPSKSEEDAARFEAFSLNHLKSAPPGSDLQLAWLDAFLQSLRTPDGMSFAEGLLRGKKRIPGLRIDQEVRWNLISSLAANGAPNAKELIDEEAKQDLSRAGQDSRLAALARLPSPENKTEWLGKIEDAGQAGGSTAELSSSKLKTVMRNFQIVGQESALAPLAARYFAFLPQAVQCRDEQFMVSYTRSLFPALCNAEVVTLTQHALDTLGSALPASAEKNLRTHLQQEQRCLKARAYFLSTISTGQ